MESHAVKINKFNGKVACHCHRLVDNTLNTTHRSQDRDSYSEIMTKMSTWRCLFRVLSEGLKWASILWTYFSVFLLFPISQSFTSSIHPSYHPTIHPGLMFSKCIWFGWFFLWSASTLIGRRPHLTGLLLNVTPTSITHLSISASFHQPSFHGHSVIFKKTSMFQKPSQALGRQQEKKARFLPLCY